MTVKAAVIMVMTATMTITMTTAAAIEPEGRFANVSMHQVMAALQRQCFEAGMAVAMPDDHAVLCSVIVARGDELLLRADDLPRDVSIGRVHGGEIAHQLRFTLAERDNDVRVWAHAWLTVSEADGAVLEEDIGSPVYLARLQRVFDDLAASFADPADDDSEHELRLAAHLRAVAHCDRLSADLDVDAIDEGLRVIGLHPYGSSPRDRCEALYEVVFEWGLARGMERPDMQGFRAFLDAQPDDRRVCMGRVSLASYCDRP